MDAFSMPRKEFLRMKRKLIAGVCGIALTAMVMVLPVQACTPPLHLDMPQISNIKYEPNDQMKAACDNAAKKYLEEHPIDLDNNTEDMVEATKPDESTAVDESYGVDTVEQIRNSYREYCKKWFSRFK
jgi:hypothetical protein